MKGFNWIRNDVSMFPEGLRGERLVILAFGRKDGVIDELCLPWAPRYREVATSQNGHHQKNLQTINTREGAEKKKPSYTVCGNVNWCNKYGKQYGGSSKN